MRGVDPSPVLLDRQLSFMGKFVNSFRRLCNNYLQRVLFCWYLGCTPIIGLALFVENKHSRVELDLLLVKPEHHRTGIATAMVASAANSLYAEGVRDLRCGYHICNERSRAWQHKFGFEEIPEYFYCKLKSSWYRHEIWRREALGQIEQLEELGTEKDRWDRLVQDLEPF